MKLADSQIRQVCKFCRTPIGIHIDADAKMYETKKRRGLSPAPFPQPSQTRGGSKDGSEIALEGVTDP